MEEQQENQEVPLRDFLRIFAAVMLPMFLAAVDQTLLATATPAIATDLGGLRDASWIAVGYLLATTVMGPLYGRLGDRYGRREVLLAAVVVFAAGSAACALAGSMTGLVVARVVQGLGGGGLMVMSQALIGELVPARQRGRFQGYFAAVFTLSSVIGPLIGGIVVAHVGWRWLFWANLPLCAFAAWRIWHLSGTQRGFGGAGAALPDILGAAWFALAATLALLGLSLGGSRFDGLSLQGLVFAVVMVVLWAGLIRRERRHATPFLPVELLRERAIRMIAIAVTCFTSCMFSLIFFLPLYLQLGHRMDAARAGLLMLPLTAGLVISSTLTGRALARSGRAGRLPAVGLGWSAAMLVLLGLIPPSPMVVGVLGFAAGLGFGTVMPSAQLAVQVVAGRAKLGAAAATVSLFRSLGAALGTALFGAVVFGLLDGTDLQAALHGTADPATVIRAFQLCFFGTAAVALAGAVVAARTPSVRL